MRSSSVMDLYLQTCCRLTEGTFLMGHRYTSLFRIDLSSMGMRKAPRVPDKSRKLQTRTPPFGCTALSKRRSERSVVNVDALRIAQNTYGGLDRGSHGLFAGDFSPMNS